MGRLPAGMEIPLLNDDMFAWVDMWLLRALFSTPKLCGNKFDAGALKILNTILRAEHQADAGRKKFKEAWAKYLSSDRAGTTFASLKRSKPKQSDGAGDGDLDAARAEYGF